MKDIRNYQLLHHNTFGIAADCDRFLEYQTEEEAQQVAAILRKEQVPYLIIGSGSNLLLTGDFHGIVVHSAIKGMEIQDPTTEKEDSVYLRCGSGEVWDEVVAYCVANNLHGTENLSLIPGEVGASAVQNIGAYGSEVQDLIVLVEAVEIATGRIVQFHHDDCRYAYRQSRFKREWKDRYLMTHVTYRLNRQFTPKLDYGNILVELEKRRQDSMADTSNPNPTDTASAPQPSAQELRDVIINIRNARLPDPKEQGNGGSFFVNPVVPKEKYMELAAQYPNMPHYTVDDDHEKIPAGWLIEQCGWKGKSLGKAGVHDKQALVLVNRGGATGADIVALMRAIQADVETRFGIAIQPEVNVV